MTSQKVLTTEIAEKYKQDADSVSLAEFTAVEDGALRIFAMLDEQHGDGLLDLSGLSEITGKQLGLLNTMSVALSCGGITHITSDMASALKHFANGKIGFLSVSEVDDGVLQQLAEYAGPGLFLGLTEVSEDQAKILASCKAQLLALPSLALLGEDAAAALVEYEGELSLSLRPLPIETRRILRQHGSFADWGEVKTHAEPVCKFCGEKGRIFIFSDTTPYDLLRDSNKVATEGWTWNICPACSEGLSDDEISELLDCDA